MARPSEHFVASTGWISRQWPDLLRTICVPRPLGGCWLPALPHLTSRGGSRRLTGRDGPSRRGERERETFNREEMVGRGGSRGHKRGVRRVGMVGRREGGEEDVGGGIEASTGSS